MSTPDREATQSGMSTVVVISPRGDAALLAGLYAGNEADFEALFQRYYRPIHDLLERLVGDEADDLAQEVFWRLYTRPPRADVGLKAWLYRVATRLGYNALRARRRQKRHYEMWASSYPNCEEGRILDPEATTEQRAECDLVRAALARLKRREATLLVLRYSGLRYIEIAQVMGLSPNSVGTLLARAERAFAVLYAEMKTAEGGRG